MKKGCQGELASKTVHFSQSLHILERNLLRESFAKRFDTRVSFRFHQIQNEKIHFCEKSLANEA